MFVKDENAPVTKVFEARGGEGFVNGRNYLRHENAPEGSVFRMVAIMTLEPGASVGYHVHENNEEVYSILSGSGIYSDNGKEIEVGPGDTTLAPRGTGHGIKNSGDAPLVFFAVIAE